MRLLSQIQVDFKQNFPFFGDKSYGSSRARESRRLSNQQDGSTFGSLKKSLLLLPGAGCQKNQVAVGNLLRTAQTPDLDGMIVDTLSSYCRIHLIRSSAAAQGAEVHG